MMQFDGCSGEVLFTRADNSGDGRPPLRFLSFSSGSCGNCYLLIRGGKGLVIDAGASPRRIRKVLASHGLDLDCFQAVLVTHDHLDHIRFLGAFCQKFQKPVYAPRALHDALAVHTFTASSIAPCRRVIPESEWSEVLPGVLARPFPVPHDATATVGYSVDFEGERFTIMTDLGQVTDEAAALARESSTVVVESNYDVDMLMRGPYTPALKARILRSSGHLSNEDCASAIRRFFHPGLRNIFLCHLSENNNTPALAYGCARAALNSCGVALGGGSSPVYLCPLPRRTPSDLFFL